MSSLSLPADATVLVASDMHLGAHDPGTARFFLAALHDALPGHSHLMLLGDLFEAWPGDDNDDPIAQCLIDALARLCGRHETYVMAGNRDFLMQVAIPGASAQSGFDTKTGARLLEDPTVLTLGEQRILLMHGDSLCTDDADYQQQRAQARDINWQQQFLSKTLAERQAIAANLREQSKLANQGKSPQLMDVNLQAVDDALSLAGCQTLLHGHTHRPGQHNWPGAKGQRVRVVLPDWDDKDQRGGFVRISAQGLEIVPLANHR